MLGASLGQDGYGHTHTHTLTHAQTHAYTCTHIFRYAHTRIHSDRHTHAHIHIYSTHTWSHTSLHLHIDYHRCTWTYDGTQKPDPPKLHQSGEILREAAAVPCRASPTVRSGQGREGQGQGQERQVHERSGSRLAGRLAGHRSVAAPRRHDCRAARRLPASSRIVFLAMNVAEHPMISIALSSLQTHTHTPVYRCMSSSLTHALAHARTHSFTHSLFPWPDPHEEVNWCHSAGAEPIGSETKSIPSRCLLIAKPIGDRA